MKAEIILLRFSDSFLVFEEKKVTHNIKKKNDAAREYIVFAYWWKSKA